VINGFGFKGLHKLQFNQFEPIRPDGSLDPDIQNVPKYATTQERLLSHLRNKGIIRIKEAYIANHYASVRQVMVGVDDSEDEKVKRALLGPGEEHRPLVSSYDIKKDTGTYETVV
jgi:hypothetical protein